MSFDFMDWKRCEREFIRRVDVDLSRIDSIVKMAKLRLKRVQSERVNGENICFVVEDYYEVIKELLVVYLLLNGLRSRNHQCLISFFYRKNPDCETWAFLISQMSFFRNRLTYYGDCIPLSFYEKNSFEFRKIIKYILGLILER